jgi:hypothetical protein
VYVLYLLLVLHFKAPASFQSRCSAVGIATWYGGTTEGLEFESGLGQELFPLHVVQTGSEAHPAFCLMGTGGKATGAWSWPLISS